MTICFCQVTHKGDFENTKTCVERIAPYVDRIIIIHDNLSPEEIKWLQERKCEVYTHPWQDSTSPMRNQYLEKLNDGDWCVTSDPDEQYDIEICKNLRNLIASAEEFHFNMILINSHDVWIKDDGSTEDMKGDYHKPLIFKYVKGVQYVGTIHETLIGAQWLKIQASDKYFYRHIKKHSTVWRNAVRNHFCCGGGDNLADKNPYWVELRSICDSIGIKSWYQFDEYLKKGNIDQHLKEWMIKLKDIDEQPWHSELREHYLYYFVHLHPEEAPSPEEIEKTKIHHWSKGPPTYPEGGITEYIIKLKEIFQKQLGRLPSKCEQEQLYAQNYDLEKLETFLDFYNNLKKSGLKEAFKVLPLAIFVGQVYHELLGREVDESGFQSYCQLIVDGTIRREDLPRILMQSEEYKATHPTKNPSHEALMYY